MADEAPSKIEASSAPAPVVVEGAASVGGIPLTLIIKGGTTPSSYDKQQAEFYANAEARRDYQDTQFAAPKGVIVGNIDSKPVAQAVSLYSMQMSSAQFSPKLVLHYRNRDKTIARDCVSELIESPNPETDVIDRSFVISCPKCTNRGVKLADAQMLITSTNRKFHIDARRFGQFETVEYDWGIQEQVLLAGTVTCDDIIRCRNFNCDWAVHIDDSNVYEV